ncbi:hypothetical protein FSP39_017636 [Pinctada imbricata]|uniref:Uncharacterized protein n=1 Tax=Pinctada imbricata TaxID=66713 RepID=A0AA88XJ83_PINIB|nr:hypothetical protein FSP39_017636 [Pinctada imbricata]
MDSFNFEKLLEKNTERFLEELGKPKFEGVKQKLTESEALLFRDSKLDSIKWIFVKKCLTALYVLHKTLEVSMKAFSEANQERVDLKPPKAPPLSPDTLGMGQQKTIQTTLQFVVILAICPNLQPGVGVPIERRSEFGKLVSKSGEEAEEGMKNDCLFMTSKVLMACAESPSLGSLILSRHLNDLLAMLLQLVHTFDAVKSKSKNPPNRGFEKSENLKQSLDGNDTDAKDVESCKHISVKIADVEVAEEMDQESCVGSDVEGVGQKEVGSTVSEQSYNASPENAGSSSSVVGESSEDVNKSSSQPDIDLDLCKTLLAELLRRVRPPLLVKELLVLQAGPGPKMGPAGKPILQRAPTWLRKTCGRLLTDILIKPKGVLNVVQGMLADVSGGTSTSKLSDWRKCDAVAKVIACCPMQQTSMGEYYRQITPQIFELLNIQEKTVARDFLRVACTTISYMASQNFQLTKELVIDPIIEPLMRCTRVTDAKPVGRVIVTDTEISQCVENIHRRDSYFIGVRFAKTAFSQDNVESFYSYRLPWKIG